MTAEDFEKTHFIPSILVRSDAVKWYKRMFNQYIGPDHPDREKVLYYLTTITSSLENTTELFKIQIIHNTELDSPLKITTDSLYYEKLFKSHQLWTDVAQQINIIINYAILIDNHNFVFDLFHKQDSETQREVIRGIILNWYLPEIMKELENNSNEMLKEIKMYKALRSPK